MRFGKEPMLAVLALAFLLNFSSQRAIAQDRGDKDTLQPVQGLTVFDANSKRVGAVLGFTGSNGNDTVVAFRFRGELIIIAIDGNGLRFAPSPFGWGANPFFFESSNCMGTPFELASSTRPTLAPSIFLMGSNLYTPDGPPRNIIARSRKSMNFPDNPCFPVNSLATTGIPWRFLIDLGTQFQPPFTMR